MASAAAKARDQRQARTQAQRRRGPAGILRAHLQARHDAALEGDENVVTKEPVTRCAAGGLALRRREAPGDGIGRSDHRRGGAAPRADLRKPGMRGESKATNTLFAGIQMILPGEVAPAHQHVSSAIRFVLDGEGAYTAVEGEKTVMSPGDFVITANWAPHDHGNTSKKPMLWLDVLDFPQVNFFETSFAEHFDDTRPRTPRRAGRRLARLLRLRRAAGRRPAHINRSPVINYTYARTRPDHRAHEQGRRRGQAPRRTRALRQSRSTVARCCPLWAPISRCCRRVSKARSTARPTARSSSASRARARPRSTTRCWNGDPTTCSWCRRGSTTRTMPQKESVLFSISDRPAQEALGIWREDTRTHSVPFRRSYHSQYPLLRTSETNGH